MPEIMLARDRLNAPIQALAPGPTTVVTVVNTGASVMASDLSATTVCIRLIATVDTLIAIGATGAVSASAGSMLLPAGIPEYFRVTATTSQKVSGLGLSAGGNLYITEMF